MAIFGGQFGCKIWLYTVCLLYSCVDCLCSCVDCLCSCHSIHSVPFGSNYYYLKSKRSIFGKCQNVENQSQIMLMKKI